MHHTFGITVNRFIRPLAAVCGGGEGEASGAVDLEIPTIDTVVEEATLRRVSGAVVTPLAGTVWGGLGWFCGELLD